MHEEGTIGTACASVLVLPSEGQQEKEEPDSRAP